MCKCSRENVFIINCGGQGTVLICATAVINVGYGQGCDIQPQSQKMNNYSSFPIILF